MVKFRLSKKYLNAILGLAITLGLLLRIALIFKKPIAADEIWEFLLIKASVQQIWFGTFAELHPPLFFIVLHFLSKLLPLDMMMLRLISLSFAILATVAMTYMVNILLGNKVAIVALFLCLFLPSFVWASIFARYYSFLILLTALSMIVFLDFLNKPHYKKLILLTVIFSIGTYIHYYFSLLLLAFGSYLLLQIQYRKFLKQFSLTFLGVFLLFIPGLVSFYALPKPQVIGIENNFLKIPSIALTNIVSFEELIYVYYKNPHFLEILILAGLFLILLYIGILGWINLKQRLRSLILLILFLPPVVTLVISYILRPVLGLNSLLIFLPAYIVVLSNGIWVALKKGLSTTLIFSSLVLLTLIIFFRMSTMSSTLIKPFDFIRSQWRDGDLVLHANLYTFMVGAYYLKDGVNFGAIHTVSTPFTEEALGYKMIPGDPWQYRRRIWYVEPGFYNVVKARAFKYQLDEKMKLVDQQQFPDSLFNVYLYDVKESMSY